MRTHYSFYILLATAISLSACIKHDEIATYSGIDNIYFPTSETKLVTMAYTPDISDTLVRVPIAVIGKPEGTDRPYQLQVAANSTAREGQHFDFRNKNFYIPANGLKDTVEIILHKTSDLKTDTVALILELVANEAFQTEMRSTVDEETSFIHYTILSTDMLTRPVAWNDALLGMFSAKKFLLMGELLHLELTDFNSTALTTTADIRYYSEFMKRYLNAQRLAGNTIYEEDGVTEMRMEP